MRLRARTGWTTLYDAGFTKWQAAQAACAARDYATALPLYREAMSFFVQSQADDAPRMRRLCGQAIEWHEQKLGIARPKPIAAPVPDMTAEELLQSIREDHAAPVDAEGELEARRG